MSNSNRFAASSDVIVDSPVTLPPGCERLAFQGQGLDLIGSGRHNEDRDPCARSPRGKRGGGTAGDDHGDVETDELFRHRGKLLERSLRGADLERDVATIE